MITAVVGFAGLLRRHGVPVGTDRTMAASAALALTDLADREALRRTLLMTLIGHRHHEPAFDQLFDQWFDGGWTEQMLMTGGDESTDTDPVAVAADVELALDTERRLRDATYVDDPSERVGVATDRGERGRGSATALLGAGGDRIATAIDASVGVGRSTNEASTGTADTDAEGVDCRVTSLHLPAGTGDDPPDGELVDELRAAMAAAQGARAELLAEALGTSGIPRGPAESRARRLAVERATAVLANPFDALEQQQLDRIVDMVLPQLDGGPAWRRRGSPQGDLDMRRILRAAATTGGVPMEIRRRSPGPTRPKVLVLVDTSLSVRPTARLMLHLAHRLRSRIGRVRVLAFIDRCVDVTEVLRHADLARALGRLLDDPAGGPLDPARSSDHGAAFRSLWTDHPGLVTRWTTTLVLGDGRSNGLDPDIPALRSLVERSRRTVWFTPEAEGAWGFGHGEMRRYADEVDLACTIRTLDDLEAVARSGVVESLRSRNRTRNHRHAGDRFQAS